MHTTETPDTHSTGCMHNHMSIELFFGIAGIIIVCLASTSFFSFFFSLFWDLRQ